MKLWTFDCRFGLWIVLNESPNPKSEAGAHTHTHTHTHTHAHVYMFYISAHIAYNLFKPMHL
jgi:hypothetical protein